MSRSTAWYATALLGPLGAGVVAPMLPGLATAFDTSEGTVGASITAYMLPFAAVQLVSGTIGERAGRRRSVQAGFLLYAIGSALCAAAPSLGVFMTGRVLQGVANGFTTPLVLAAVAEQVAPARLPTAVGFFGANQAAGQSLAPLVGGLAMALASWRWAFVAVTLVALLLATSPPPGEARRGLAAPRFRSLLSFRMGAISIGALTSYAGSAGLPFLVALSAQRRFDTSDSRIGVLLVGFGAVGIIMAPLWSRVAQRLGAGRCLSVGLLGTGALVAATGFVPSEPALAATWTAAGAFSSLTVVSMQIVVTQEVPSNRGGAVSVASAFRFGGGAFAPVLLLPLYPAGAGTAHVAFAVAGAISVVGALASVGLWRSGRGPVPAVRPEPSPTLSG